jgi:hypothetical protein
VSDTLLAEVVAAAQTTDEARRLPTALVERLARAGLFRLLVPRTVGGEEADVRTFAEAIERIATADASAAWCLYRCGVTALAVSLCLAPDPVEAIFSDPFAVIASGAGGGTDHSTPGGHRVSGLRGTSSDGYTLHDVFVPTSFGGASTTRRAGRLAEDRHAVRRRRSRRGARRRVGVTRRISRPRRG